MSNFNNDTSMVGFIGSYSSVDEVIAQDEQELREIGGSFEEIADRMKSIGEYAASATLKDYFHLVNPLYNDNIEIVFYGLTKGPQFCPFMHQANTCNEVIRIQNTKTKKALTINRITEHLAREHHLLEKGNEYGISAKEFYAEFM